MSLRARAMWGKTLNIWGFVTRTHKVWCYLSNWDYLPNETSEFIWETLRTYGLCQAELQSSLTKLGKPRKGWWHNLVLILLPPPWKSGLLGGGPTSSREHSSLTSTSAADPEHWNIALEAPVDGLKSLVHETGVVAGIPLKSSCRQHGEIGRTYFSVPSIYFSASPQPFCPSLPRTCSQDRARVHSIVLSRTF